MALAAKTADRDSKRLHVQNGDGGATVTPISMNGQKEGTIAHVDKPPDKPRVSRVRPGEGHHSRVPQSGGRNTHAIAVVESTRHRNASTRIMSATYCQKRAPGIHVSQE